MKRIRSVSCLIALFLLVLSAEIGMGQEVTNSVNVPKASADYRAGEETTDGGYVVNLEVDGGFLTLTIPADYQYQPVELTEIERYPFTYILPMTIQGFHSRCTVLCIASKIRNIYCKNYMTRVTRTSFMMMF